MGKYFYVFGCIWCFIASSLNNLGYTAKEIGLFYIPISVFFILGSTFARFFSVTSERKTTVIYIGVAMYIIGAAIQLFVQYADMSNHWFALVLPFSVMTLGTGMMLPVLVAAAIHLFSHASGASASLIGVSQKSAGKRIFDRAARLSVSETRRPWMA